MARIVQKASRNSIFRPAIPFPKTEATFRFRREVGKEETSLRQYGKSLAALSSTAVAGLDELSELGLTEQRALVLYHNASLSFNAFNAFSRLFPVSLFPLNAFAVHQFSVRFGFNDQVRHQRRRTLESP